ncbi:MAG: LysR family transcriptional regulator [Parvularcula sp.]
MDWRAVTFDWNKARAFLVTAEEGSLSAAARALGMNQPTLSRQVSTLEEDLGVTLFERIGKGLELTPHGEQLVDHVRRMGEAAMQFSLTVSGQIDQIEGWVAISASDAVSTFLLPKMVRAIKKAEPGIRIEIIASNTTSDLRRREADIAIRHTAPTEPDLISKKVREVNCWLYSTREYLWTIGTLTSLDDLRRAAFVGFGDIPALVSGLVQMGIPVSTDNFHLSCENGVVAWDLVKQGMGVGLVTEDIAVMHPELIKVPIPHDPIVINYWLVAHKELRTNRRIRFVFDHLAKSLEQ